MAAKSNMKIYWTCFLIPAEILQAGIISTWEKKNKKTIQCSYNIWYSFVSAKTSLVIARLSYSVGKGR